MLRLQQKEMVRFVSDTVKNNSKNKPDFTMYCAKSGGKWFLTLCESALGMHDMRLTGQRGDREFSSLDAAYNVCAIVNVPMLVIGQ